MISFLFKKSVAGECKTKVQVVGYEYICMHGGIK